MPNIIPCLVSELRGLALDIDIKNQKKINKHMDIKVTDFESMVLKLASPEKVLSWSHGEVLKPETINYRSSTPGKKRFVCEKIFGPEKNFECYCGKYKRIRYKGIVCEKCGVEVTGFYCAEGENGTYRFRPHEFLTFGF